MASKKILVREYIRKADEKKFIRYGQEMFLFCADDTTGMSDTRITHEKIKEEYELVASYEEDE